MNTTGEVPVNMRFISKNQIFFSFSNFNYYCFGIQITTMDDTNNTLQSGTIK